MSWFKASSINVRNTRTIQELHDSRFSQVPCDVRQGLISPGNWSIGHPFAVRPGATGDSTTIASRAASARFRIARKGFSRWWMSPKATDEVRLPVLPEVSDSTSPTRIELGLRLSRFLDIQRRACRSEHLEIVRPWESVVRNSRHRCLVQHGFEWLSRARKIGTDQGILRGRRQSAVAEGVSKGSCGR